MICHLSGLPGEDRGIDGKVRDSAIFPPGPISKDAEELELSKAGIDPSRQVGSWEFSRSGRYWVANGDPLPEMVSRELSAHHFDACRAHGDCTAPTFGAAIKRGPIEMYHIDTPESLRALAVAIKAGTA